MNWILQITITIIAKAALLWFLAHHLFPESFVIEGGINAYVILAIVFGVLNTCVKPIIRMLTFPIHLVTLGLFSLFLNGVILWMAEKSINFLGFEGVTIDIKGPLITILTGVLLSVLSTIINWFMSGDD